MDVAFNAFILFSQHTNYDINQLNAIVVTGFCLGCTVVLFTLLDFLFRFF